MAEFDFMKGLEYLKSNLQDLSAQRSILGANEKVQQIKTSELAEAEKMTQLRSVAQNLTMNLAGQGVPIDRIETLSNAIAPKPTPFQNAEGAMISGNPEQQAIGRKLYDEEYARKRNLLQLETDAKLAQFGVKNTKAEGKEVLKQMELFQKAPQPKAILEGMNQLDTLKTYLAENNPLTFGLAKRALIVSSGDKRVSNEDVKAMQGDPSVIAEAKRAWETYAKGGVLPQDRKQLEHLVMVMEAKNKNKLQAQIKNFAGGRAQWIGISPEALERQLSINYLGKDPMQAAAPAVDARVTVMKDGKQFSVPQAQLDAAMKQGYLPLSK